MYLQYFDHCDNDLSNDYIIFINADDDKLRFKVTEVEDVFGFELKTILNFINTTIAFKPYKGTAADIDGTLPHYSEDDFPHYFNNPVLLTLKDYHIKHPADTVEEVKANWKFGYFYSTLEIMNLLCIM